MKAITSNRTASRILYIVALVIAGEMVFGLPFHTTRFFLPTFLEVFGLTNTQLGDVRAVYGITAMLSYFPGGALADRFSARALLTASLVATAAGGVVMATIPTPFQLGLIFGFWGISTILLFWGALIRATREWGGTSAQGVAFGILDGGRGLVAAMFGFAMVAVLAGYLPDDATLSTDAERRAGLQMIILSYSAATLFAAAVVWTVIPNPNDIATTRSNPFKGMPVVIKQPIIWAQAGIIVCAYCGYKGLDNYSLYAVQVLGMDEVEGARLANYGAWVRPVACVVAGIIADRFDTARSVGASFLLLLLAYSVLSVLTPDVAGLNIIFINLFVTYFSVFALRGIYFALLEETRTPRSVTGVSVGMISFIGYTPDFFFGPVGGRILDASPGVEGHLDYFRFLAVIAALGIIVVAWLLRLKKATAK